MSASHVETWRNQQTRGFDFGGHINQRDLSMTKGEIIERIKGELVSSIVQQIMEEFGPLLDRAIRDCWKDSPINF